MAPTSQSHEENIKASIFSLAFLTRRGNYSLLGRRLFQQLMVTVHGKIETERL